MSFSIFDMHTHTKYSCDSDLELESCCAEAIQKGIKAICFTDHVDCNCNDAGCGFYTIERFFDEFVPLKEKYKSKLTLLCGVEFAEPHMYQDEFVKHSSYPYDYILASIHWWYENMWASQMLKQGISAEVCYEYYWSELLAAVKFGGFDCVAHMDFPKRYYNELIIDYGKISEIFAVMVSKNICLEINTSSLRQNRSNGTMPDKEILEIYKDCGGKYVAFGSDAHKAGELGEGYPYAKNLIDFFGFTAVMFTGRNIVKI